MSLVGSLASLTQLTLPPRLSIQFSASLKRLRLLQKLTSRKRPLTDSVLSMLSMKPFKRLPMLLKPIKTPLRLLKQLLVPLIRLKLTQRKRSPIRYLLRQKLMKLLLQWTSLILLSKIRMMKTFKCKLIETAMPPTG